MKNTKLFNMHKPIFGMIHVKALPGTPMNRTNVENIIENALKEAQIYKQCGIDALLIENMHDTPYLNGFVGPEIVAALSVIGREVKKETKLVTGIQILAAANIEALAVAYASNLDFIRAEGFVFAHVADEGIIESNAGKLLRYRKQIGADNVKIFTDIKKKHSSHSITNDVNIVETAHAAEFFESDGLIVTGQSTGTSADLSEVSAVHKHSKIPVLVGSGITTENLKDYISNADGFIVGSYFKKDGYWKNDLDPKKIESLMNKKSFYTH